MECQKNLDSSSYLSSFIWVVYTASTLEHQLKNVIINLYDNGLESPSKEFTTNQNNFLNVGIKEKANYKWAKLLVECGMSLKEAKLKIDLWLMTNTTVPIGKIVVSYTNWKNHMLLKCLRLEKLYVIVLITIPLYIFLMCHAYIVSWY